MRTIGHQRTAWNGLLAAAAGMLLLLTHSADASAAEPDAIVLRSRVFDIPFHIDGSSRATVVKLYVSTDRGQSWKIASEQPLPVTGFHFEATAEGEHWFAHATDLDTLTDPASQLSPERKILIDSTGPAITLEGQADLQGTFAGRVTLKDIHGLSSLRVLYATDVDRQWKTVANGNIDDDGRFQIQPAMQWRQMSVHITATDTVGNVSVEAKIFRRPRIAASRNQLRIRPAAGPSDPPNFVLGPGPQPEPHGPTTPHSPPTSSADDRAPSPGSEFIRGLGTFGSAFGGGAAPPAPAAAKNRMRPPTAMAEKSAGGESPGLATLPAAGLTAKVTSKGVEVLQAPSPDPTGPLDPNTPPPGSDAGTSSAAPSANAAPALPLNAPTLAAPSPGAPITKSTLPETNTLPETATAKPDPSRSPRTLAEAMRPLLPEAKTPTPAAPEEIPAPSPSGTPEDLRRQRVERATTLGREQQEQYDRAQLARSVPFRFSNSNRFSLEYELEAVSASGVEAVELYGSTDAGRTWKRWGADPDRNSPFDIETKGAGVFGFRIVVIGNNGLASPRPFAGDDPDIAVIVDQTRPTIKITSAQYGEGNRTGSLVIRYECDDENLMTRPVSIAFSESLEGPWTTIAAGLRNDGLYVWPADPKLPPRIYLRIDATDQAGNTGSFLLDQPIATSGLAPRARILGFRSR